MEEAKCTISLLWMKLKWYIKRQKLVHLLWNEKAMLMLYRLLELD